MGPTPVRVGDVAARTGSMRASSISFPLRSPWRLGAAALLAGCEPPPAEARRWYDCPAVPAQRGRLCPSQAALSGPARQRGRSPRSPRGSTGRWWSRGRRSGDSPSPGPGLSRRLPGRQQHPSPLRHRGGRRRRRSSPTWTPSPAPGLGQSVDLRHVDTVVGPSRRLLLDQDGSSPRFRAGAVFAHWVGCGGRHLQAWRRPPGPSSPTPTAAAGPCRRS